MTTATAIDVDLHRAVAQVRAALWRRLAELVSFPTGALVLDIADGSLATAICDLAGALPYPLAVDRVAVQGPAAAAAAESEYIRLFDVPVDGAPIPLYGGLHAGHDRRQVMEELLRHYRHFGLTTSGARARDLPDALATVLEFLQFLALIEARDRVAADAVRAAQRQVLGRHVTRWMPAILHDLAGRNPLPLYRGGLELVERFAVAECEHLGGRTPGQPVAVGLHGAKR